MSTYRQPKALVDIPRAFGVLTQPPNKICNRARYSDASALSSSQAVTQLGALTPPPTPASPVALPGHSHSSHCCTFPHSLQGPITQAILHDSTQVASTHAAGYWIRPLRTSLTLPLREAPCRALSVVELPPLHGPCLQRLLSFDGWHQRCYEPDANPGSPSAQGPLKLVCVCWGHHAGVR